jgi:hypothetical protein
VKCNQHQTSISVVVLWPFSYSPKDFFELFVLSDVLPVHLISNGKGKLEYMDGTNCALNKHECTAAWKIFTEFRAAEMATLAAMLSEGGFLYLLVNLPHRPCDIPQAPSFNCFPQAHMAQHECVRISPSFMNRISPCSCLHLQGSRWAFSLQHKSKKLKLITQNYRTLAFFW